MKNTKNSKKLRKKSENNKKKMSSRKQTKIEASNQKREIVKNIQMSQKKNKKQIQDNQVQKGSDKDSENNKVQSSSKQIFRSPQRDASKKRFDQASKNRLKLQQDYSPIPCRKEADQIINQDSQFLKILQKIDDSKKQSKKNNSQVQKNSKQKNKSDSPNKKTMEEFEKYLEKEQRKSLQNTQKQDKQQNKSKKKYQLPDKQSFIDAENVLDQGFVQAESQQEQRHSKQQRYENLIEYSTIEIPQEHENTNKYEQRTRYPRILLFMNESAKKTKESIEIKRISIDNKNDYLSKKPNSIYYHPKELKSQKERKINKNFENNQLDDVEVGKIFENEEEMIYRFSLEAGEEKETVKTDQKLEIQVYKYTDAELEVLVGSQEEKMEKNKLKNGKILEIPKGSFYQIKNMSKEKANIGLTKFKNENQINYIQVFINKKFFVDK